MSFVNAALHAVPSLVPPSVYEQPTDAAHELRGEISLRLDLRHAGIRQLTLRYELIGDAASPVVLVAGGISAHRHVVASETFPENGWANALAQGGRALDPARVRLLAIDYLGADGKLDVPMETADQADAIVQLLDALRIDASCTPSSVTPTAHWSACNWPRAIRRACANWSRSAAPIARIRMPPHGARCSARRWRWASCNAPTRRDFRWRGSSPC